MSLFPPSRTITVPAALRDLAEGAPKSRVLAATALGEVADGDRERAIAALIKALDDTHGHVRAEAASSLGNLGAKPAAVALGERLTDGDAGVRQQAAIALGTIASPEGFAPLAKALAEGPADVRFQAATSLAEIDPVAAYDPLVAALGDADPQVVSAIALSLGAIGDGRAVLHLVKLLEHGDPGVRFDAGYALAEMKDARGQDVLAKNIDDTTRAWDAVTALEWLGAVDAIVPLLTMRKAEPNAQLLAAGAVLRLRPGDETAQRLLLAGLGNRKPNLRGLAIQQLATAGGAWAITPLTQLRGSRKGSPFTAEIDETLGKLR